MSRMIGLTCVTLALALAGPVHAAAPRPTVLPLAGLRIAVAGVEVRSRYTLDPAGGFVGQDIVTDRLGRETWVSIGWFEADGCTEVLGAVPLFDAWERAHYPLWDTRVSVRGGIFAPPLGGDDVPAVALCVARDPRKQLLVVQTFPDVTDRGEGTLLDLLAQAQVARAIHRAYRADHTAPVAARAGPDITRAGAGYGEVRLRAGVELALPDDGNVWVHSATYDGGDRLDRVAPALPERTVEIITLDGTARCADAFALLDEDRVAARPSHVPPGWEAGPTFDHAGVRSATLCRRVRSGLVFTAIITATRTFDLRDVGPLHAALAVAFERSGPRVDPADPLTTAALPHVLSGWLRAPAPWRSRAEAARAGR